MTEPLPEALHNIPLPVALRDISLPTRGICFFFSGYPNLKKYWGSLQSDQEFEAVKTRNCSILANAITGGGVVLAINGVFVTTSSPVTDIDYTSPAPYFLSLTSRMFAMIAMVISGLSMMRWLHADRERTKEQVRRGGYFLISHLLSIVTPMFFLALSMSLFFLAILIAGFSSQSITCLIVTALWMVAYIIGIGAVSVEWVFAWRHAPASNDGEHNTSV
ncbi:hypothetical protein DEU56DRAFT_920325 [Suillus clintonianus]|uniref:uncharacterized protein n=1 Tax=Suillus clintonianus TaxID=1904413 RepID=UPI001B870276|nr:uncharacterized protein DEU56DRAFT_920325 [Suillus clintonianus]KAG2109519.1 hypothetical protein DEU56DRAFT_920325 [Suillus clintonianus]